MGTGCIPTNELYSSLRVGPSIFLPIGFTLSSITILTSLVSLFTQKRVKKNIAMTGEITLRGKVLPVGGIKEKILAAKRANIKEIILSSYNRKDIEEVNQKYLKGLKFIYVDTMKDVIFYALTNRKVQNPKLI